MIGYYENHISIRKNRLCPFKLSHTVAAHSSPCNWHNNVEVIYITGGKSYMQYATDRIPLEKGDMVIVNSGAIHQLNIEPGFSFYYLIVDEQFCNENGLSLTDVNFEKLFRDGKTQEKYFDVVSAAEKYDQTESPLSIAEYRSSVLSLVIDLCSRHIAKDGESYRGTVSSEEHVKLALEKINANYLKPISLDELANYCGITKYHLARLFKLYTGQTIFTYINVLRCQKAELCIREGMSITEAAYESGFESLSYFSRTYKKLMKTPPSNAKSETLPSNNQKKLS